ncbi:hypothetical protein DPMN_148147 [Dreissena polymorpha]|uniref:Uncharacterized protein n=1 Tax=Dreissena polymorpha TaxID=45954 RepID=A0A9D4FDE8_DREPO|nr:hypothetical protein DPMN_148147 [Dreissena polymorpha]
MTQYICMMILMMPFGVNCEANQCQRRQRWSPSGLNRTDLLCCTDDCDSNEDYSTALGYPGFEHCCTCNSQTEWSGQEKALLIEYISASGKSLVVDPDISRFNDSNLYKIEHLYGVMTEIPSDVCDWDKDPRLKVFSPHANESIKYWLHIVQIDFRSNKIRKVESLHFKNTTINLLTQLRHLDVSYNQIVSMDPACISQPTQNLFFANFSHNKLRELDITNAFTVNLICRVNYTSNIIENFVNALGFTLDKNKTYGPGYVSFHQNKIERFPDLTSLLGLSSLAEFGQLFSFEFDFDDYQLNCDCYLEPILRMGQELKDVLWRNYFNIYCANPPSFKNKKVHSLN